MNHIFVLSRIRFSNVVAGLSEEEKADIAFIQINDPERDSIQPDCQNVLNLWFSDAEEEGDQVILFNEDMARHIREFVLKNEDAKKWMIHCTAGISRSGAVGEILSEYFGIPYSEFRRSNPQTIPNILVKRLLSQILNS